MELENAALFNMTVWGTMFLFVVYKFFKSICLVPTRKAYIVERFGKYDRTLGPGFHALIPIMDRVVFIHDLKEETISVPPQDCFSKDEVNVIVDGVLYISVTDAAKASYGIFDYRHAAIQLAQTTTRSVIGTIDLDRTFEERDLISAKVVDVLDRAGEGWGIRVHRYEIKNITPPMSVRDSMEKQVTAERERRAILARSEGDKQAKINMSEGQKLEMINLSEGEMQKRINEAEGRAEEILTIARATAGSVEMIATAISVKGGDKAIKLKLAERFFGKFKNLADSKTRVIIPANIADFNYWLKSLNLEFKE